MRSVLHTVVTAAAPATQPARGNVTQPHNRDGNLGRRLIQRSRWHTAPDVTAGRTASRHRTSVITRSAAARDRPGRCELVTRSNPGNQWSCRRAPLSFRVMSGLRLPVIWVCGASGAGKSVAAWGLFEELAAAGTRVAYVDIDQLGMLYPAAVDDPGWHHVLKGEALATVPPGYVAAGAQLLVVSGVVDPHEGPRKQLPPGTDLTLCLLSPDPAECCGSGSSRVDGVRPTPTRRRRRNGLAPSGAVRGRSHRDDGTVSGGDRCAATRRRTRRRRGARDTQRSHFSVEHWRRPLTGARAAGSSTVGFGLAVGRWRAGRRTGFLDLQQLGFIARNGRTDSESALAVRQLAGCTT